MALSTNYIDDQIDTSANLTRKYRETVNEDGTKSFEDVTVYSRTGSAYGAAQVNAQNTEINRISESLTANGNGFYFDYQDGKYGFNTSASRGADTFSPFKSGGVVIKSDMSWASTNRRDVNLNQNSFVFSNFYFVDGKPNTYIEGKIYVSEPIKRVTGNVSLNTGVTGIIYGSINGIDWDILKVGGGRFDFSFTSENYHYIKGSLTSDYSAIRLDTIEW